MVKKSKKPASLSVPDNNASGEEPWTRNHKIAVASVVIAAVTGVDVWIGVIHNRNNQLENAAVGPQVEKDQTPPLQGYSISKKVDTATVSTQIQTAQNVGPKQPSISVELVSGVTFTNSIKALADFTVSRKLREITALESGKALTDIPAGTYYFVSGIELGVYGYGNADVTALRYLRNLNSEYEILNLIDGTVLLNGFTSSSEAANISRLNGDEAKSIVILPYATRDQPTLVSIPVTRIVGWKGRWVDVNESHDAFILQIVLK